MDQNEIWKAGEFESYEMALIECKGMVDEFLNENLPICKTADELFDEYVSFGDDPYIIPDDNENRFSTWTYAKSKCFELIQNKKNRVRII